MHGQTWQNSRDFRVFLMRLKRNKLRCYRPFPSSEMAVVGKEQLDFVRINKQLKILVC